MTKLCRYCDAPLEEISVENFTNPTFKDGRKSVAAYHCTNPACRMKPYLFRYDHINPVDPKHGDGEIVNTRQGRYYRRWFCPFCDNPVEALDPVYYLWNCPNCYELASSGVTFRYYPVREDESGALHYDEDAEAKELRHCGTCWDPFSEGPLEDEEDD